MTAADTTTRDAAATLLDRARGLLDDFRARAEETERGCMVPAASIAALRDAGLFRVGQPARYGGQEIGLDGFTAIVQEIATACASTGWVYGVLIDHNITLGMFPGAAQDDVWGDDPHTLVSSGIAPAGTVRRDGDGYRLDGRWNFSSGCDHASWVFVQSVLPPDGEGGPPTPLYLLLPRADYEIVDNWQVMGLCGTGSKEVVINNAFVPAHRTLGVRDANEGTGPGGKVNQSVLFRLPRTSTVPYSLVSPAVGIARAMYDAYVAQMGVHEARGVRLAEQATIQMRVAESSAEIDCARLLLHRACAETMEAMHRDGKLSLEQRARNRRDMAYIVTLCVRAGDRLFTGTGGGGLYAANRMQRRFRDLHAVAAHYINSWDIAGSTFGRVALGLPPNHFAI